ncbi:MAG: IS1634 family transposase [Actinomycetota bacterium]
MASIVGKRIRGKTYYYLVESARVGGRPRIVSQRYLGTATEVIGSLEGSAVAPERTRHLAFGDLAAVWGMIRRLGVVETIDAMVGPRRADAAASVGTYLALAAANRVVAPCSKLAFADWWGTTAGPRLVKVPRAALDHRRFWDAMDQLTDEHLVAIERALGGRIVSEFGIDLSGLVLDMTNFATFIDSGNEKNTIARRGHAKDGRVDLRLVGLALVVSRDGGVPLVHRAYPGNLPDVTQFASVVDELVERYRAFTAEVEHLTVVYDGGNVSVANQALVAEAPLHYVASLVTAHHKDLLAVPRSRFLPVEGFEGLSAHETQVEALGATRRAILTHSQEFHRKQARSFAQTLANCTRQLDAMTQVLARGRTRRTRVEVEAEIARILRPRWASRVITAELTGEQSKELRLSFSVDQAALASLEDEHFGKRILVTSHTDWSVAEVVAAYRSQAEVEASFRQMKDPKVVSFSPMFHWTDQKIRVHVFYCVLALAIAQLMRREAARAGMAMSVRELLRTLASIQETVLIYPSEGGRPRARRMLTETEGTAKRLFDVFGLAEYAPAR